MSQGLKIGLGIAGFVLLIVISSIAYDKLSKKVNTNDEIGLTSRQGNVSDSDADKQRAPDFVVIDGDGNSIKLSDLIENGKPIVLNFWASWCSPCKREMPEFEKVYKEFGSKVQFMMVNLADGQRETMKKGAKYVKDQGYTFPVYYDVKQEGASAYGIRSIPTTLFINKNGYIVTEVQGTINEKILKSEINKIN